MTKYICLIWRIEFPGKSSVCPQKHDPKCSTPPRGSDRRLQQAWKVGTMKQCHNYLLGKGGERLQGRCHQGCRWRLRRSCGHTELSLASRKFFYSVRNTKNQLNAILLINMDY